MDPDQTLKDLRSDIANYHKYERDEDRDGMAIMADYIVQYVEALDGWLSKGGFWPSEWAKKESL